MKYENNIKRLCKIKGITLEELATKSKVSENSIRSYSSGRLDLKKATIETATNIAKALGCGIADLFTDKALKKELKKVQK